MTNNYDGSKIQVLKGLAAVRHRPAMYIGDTDKKGLHHLIWEILDNSIDEAMAGFAKNIYITIAEDCETVTVEDDGRGIPVDMHPTEGKSSLEIAMTVLHAGGKMTSDSGGYVASGGLHGVGASCVNALSDKMSVEVHRDGNLYRQEYSRGEPLADVKKIRKLEKSEKPTGTKSTWHADTQIFKQGVKIDENEIIRRVRESCFLNRGLHVVFENKATGTKHDFKYEGGIGDYVLYLVQNKNGIYPDAPIYAQKTAENMQVEIALSWTDDDDCLLFSYANNIHTIDGGTHLSGFKTSLTRTINKFAYAANLLKEKDDGLEGRDIQEGLCAIVSIKLSQPQFVGQTKAKLGTIEAEAVVSAITNDLLTDYFERNPKSLSKVVDRALLAQKARKAAKDAAAALKKKSFLGQSGRIPGKLRDCRSSDNTVTELFIVEGDSAAGSATGGRDSETQAILSNKGKIINAEKSTVNDLFKNEEIINLMLCIGTGVKDNFDLTKLKYGKIIIMCLHGDTRIKTLDGSDATIQDLAEQKKPVWIWTRQGDEIVPYLAQPPQKTSSHKKYALLTFDDNTQVKCTLDHKFQVNNPDENDSRIIYKNGHAYIEAKDLQASDSLCHVIYGKTQIAKDAEHYERLSYIRIKNIAIIEEDQEQDFYCFNIPETGNFVLANGLISSNCDADDDGYHIRTLLLTFFYKFMRPLIENGHVYIAQAPLYMIERKNDPIYCWSDEELQSGLQKIGGKIDVKRFKGLGEMDAEQLAETSMRVGQRRLLQVTMDDAVEAERLLTVLMGKNVQLRKQHITNNINNEVIAVQE